MKILPATALDQHIAVMGKTGSGKTYAAKGIVEGLLDDGRQVVVVDPTGAWWGLRSGGDGKKAGGYDMLILGGKHGDLPLMPGSGAAVADLVCKQHARVICDTLLMTVGERTRWFTDFATAAMRGIESPLTLVIDEVHNFAPKGKVPDPSIGACMHAANTLFSGGRSLGFRMIGITQRPAKWHNDSLGSCDTMIALRMMLPADRKQIEEWIDGNGDPEAGKEVLNSLARLQKGEGWVWFPEGDVLKRLTFPKIGTYDSSATPTEKERKHPPTLAEIDLGAVRSSMEQAVKEAEANDPKKLRSKIAELERAARGKAPAPADPADTERAVARAVADRDRHWNGELVRMGRALTGYTARLTKIGELAHLNGEAFTPTVPPPPTPKGPTRVIHTGPKELTVIQGDWTQPQRQLLDAFAWFKEIGIDQPTKEQLCFRCKWSPTSSHISNVLGALRTAGAVRGLRLVADIPTPDLGTLEDYHNNIRAILDQPRRELFNHLLSIHPEVSSKEQACAALGWSDSSSHISNVVGSLRTYGICEPRGWALSAMVFPEGVPA